MIIEPVMDALTISTRPLCRAKMAIRNSTALPKVALISAEIVVETRPAMMLVDSAIRWVMPAIAPAVAIKVKVELIFK
jgi:hypothetical protein